MNQTLIGQPLNLNPFGEVAKPATGQKTFELTSPPSPQLQEVNKKRVLRKAKALKANESTDSRWKAVLKVAGIGISLIGLGGYAFSLLKAQVLETSILSATGHAQKILVSSERMTDFSIAGQMTPTISLDWTFGWPSLNATIAPSVTQMPSPTNGCNSAKKITITIDDKIQSLINKTEEPNYDPDRDFDWWLAALEYRAKRQNDKAIFCHSRAAEKGNGISMRTLERLNKEMKIEISDIESIRNAFNERIGKKILQSVEKAEKSDEVYDSFFAGVQYYYRGDSEKADYVNALSWLSKGAIKGYKPSMQLIEDLTTEMEIPNIHFIRNAFNQANQGILAKVANRIAAQIKGVTHFNHLFLRRTN